MDEHLQPRIGDRERDEAVRLLQEHLAAGRLDQDEFDERMSAALTARTMSDLAPLFADLPGPRPSTEVALPQTTITSRQRTSWKRWAGIANAVAWPLTLIILFATDWNYWWLIFIPTFLLPALLGQLKGDDDADAPPAVPPAPQPPALEQERDAGPVQYENLPYEQKLQNPDDLR